MSFNSVGACNYLARRFKDPPGLCCESIGIRNGADFEHTYWLTDDNVLAILALDRLGQTEIRNEIQANLTEFHPFDHDCFRNLGWVDPFIHQEVMYLEPVKTANCYRWNTGTNQFDISIPCHAGVGGIVHEEHNGDPFNNEYAFPDLSASKALSWHKQFQISGNASDRAKRDFFMTSLEQMWNETNLGFGSPDNDGKMQSYFLAVYLLVGEKTGWPNAFDPKRRVIVRNTLNSLQQPDNGCFSTSYNGQSGRPTEIEQYGNIETTTLAVYANIRPRDYYAF